MVKRPMSVIAYSGILILNSIVQLCSVLNAMAVQNNTVVQNSMEDVHKVNMLDYLVSSVDIAIFLICGICLFLRQGWARILLIGWVAFTLLYDLLNQELTVYSTARALAFIGLMAVFMFSAEVNAWFSGKDATMTTTS